MAPKGREGSQVKVNSGRGIWAGLLAAGVIGAGAIGISGAAAADQERGVGTGPAATIKMKFNPEQGPFFQAPSQVDKGERLEIVNRTNPKDIGPHTFTLVKESLVDSGRDQRRCGNLRSKVCKRIVRAHRFDLETGVPGRTVVDRGKNGWDRQFTKERSGDSWYTETQDENHSRKVKADVGKRLYFFCIIHPEMQGELEVR
jgi:hypothetical protein